MKIWKATLGSMPGVGESWLLRAKSFDAASAKAQKTANQKSEDYNSNVWLVSLEFIGTEE
jgi:hypothetical protein